MLIISGPTGVGKSSFAEKLAESLPAEIINADMGQMYIPFSIGTAKPDWKEHAVPHHLFDIIAEPVNFTVVEYRKKLLEKVNEVCERKKLPIIVGGSSFYLMSVFFPPQENIVSNHILNGKTKKELFERLKKIDPQRALDIGPHDEYRLKRALSIWLSTGKKPSEYMPTFDPPNLYEFLFLTRERNDLYQRINMRVEQMIHEGWIEEVEQLASQKAWQNFIRQKKLIGYDTILDFIQTPQENRNQTELLDEIAQKTRKYAKRQITFWRMMKKKLPYTKSLNLTFLNSELYIRKLSTELTLKLKELYE